MVLKPEFCSLIVDVNQHTRSDEPLFNPAPLKAKRKVEQIIIQDLLFADVAVLIVHTVKDLQTLLDELKNFHAHSTPDH